MKPPKNFLWSSTRFNTLDRCFALYAYTYRAKPLIQKPVSMIIGDASHRAIKTFFKGQSSGWKREDREFYFASAEKLAGYGLILLRLAVDEAQKEGGIYWEDINLRTAKNRVWDMLTDFYRHIVYPARPMTLLESEFPLTNVPIGQGFFFEAIFDLICRFDDTREIAIVDFSTGTTWGFKRNQLIFYSLVFRCEAERSKKFRDNFGSQPSTYVYLLPTNEIIEFVPEEENRQNLLERLQERVTELEELKHKPLTEWPKNETDNCRFCQYRVPCLGNKYPGPAVIRAGGVVNAVPPAKTKRPSGYRHFKDWRTNWGSPTIASPSASLKIPCGEHPDEHLMVWDRGEFVCPDHIGE